MKNKRKKTDAWESMIMLKKKKPMIQLDYKLQTEKIINITHL